VIGNERLETSFSRFKRILREDMEKKISGVLASVPSALIASLENHLTTLISTYYDGPYDLTKISHTCKECGNSALGYTLKDPIPYVALSSGTLDMGFEISLYCVCGSLENKIPERVHRVVVIPPSQK